MRRPVGRLALLSNLFIYLKKTVHWHLFIYGWKSDPDLLRVGEVVPLEKHIRTSYLGLLIKIFPLVYFD